MTGSLFPLTPALSLRERENYRQRAGKAGMLGIVERLAALHPLPKEEGRGEGERNVRFESVVCQEHAIHVRERSRCQGRTQWQ